MARKQTGYTVTLRLTPEANQAVDMLRKQLGMHKQVIITRVLDWFSKQDPDVISIILGHVRPRSQAVVLRLLAEHAEHASKQEAAEHPGPHRQPHPG